MNRRAFLSSLPAAATSLLDGAAADPRPNVLFISADDMNDWVGCLGGYPGVRTPNIDGLARRGALFSDAHCAAPLCNPSRTALLTGLRPSTTGIYNNDQWWRPALPKVVTLPQYFKQNGYYAAGVGKVFHHVAGSNPPDQWNEFELQVFDDPWYRRVEWYPWVKKIPAPAGHPFNGLRDFQGEFDWGVIPTPENAYGDALAVEWGRRFLERKHDRPFFLAVGLWHPHIPMFAPQSYFDMYPRDQVRLPELPADDLDDLPAEGRRLAAFRRSEHERIRKEGKWRDAVQAYLACITFADSLIGRLIGALDASGYARNTVIIFWSDNGWHLGEKQHWHKSTLWQRSTHVPLILAGPGIRSAGTARRQPVSLLDLYPTLVELCGLPARRDLEGESLGPLLRDAQAAHRPPVSTINRRNHAVVTKRWRYIRYHDGGEELYDREADPNEWRNLAAQPEHTALKRDLAQLLPSTNAAEQPERTAYDFDFTTYTWKRKR